MQFSKRTFLTLWTRQLTPISLRQASLTCIEIDAPKEWVTVFTVYHNHQHTWIYCAINTWIGKLMNKERSKLTNIHLHRHVRKWSVAHIQTDSHPDRHRHTHNHAASVHDNRIQTLHQKRSIIVLRLAKRRLFSVDDVLRNEKNGIKEK